MQRPKASFSTYNGLVHIYETLPNDLASTVGFQLLQDQPHRVSQSSGHLGEADVCCKTGLSFEDLYPPFPKPFDN